MFVITLKVVFKSQMGIPPQKYLMNLRLEKAAELLTVYGEKPTTAGASVGYPDLYHFSKMFKQRFGVAPREYQKRYREENKGHQNKEEEYESI